MDNKTALELARAFLADHIELKVHSNPSSTVPIYNFDSQTEILIEFSLLDTTLSTGSSKFVIVSKEDGSVRFAG